MGKGKPETLAYYKEKVTCQRCGSVVSRIGLPSHYTSQKCLGIKKPRKTQREYYEMNKIWRQNNRKKLNKQHLEYYYRKKHGIVKKTKHDTDTIFFSREVKSIVISFD
jgi:hypothetical protein